MPPTTLRTSKPLVVTTGIPSAQRAIVQKGTHLKSLSRSVVRPLLACLFALLLAFPSPAFGKPSSGHPKSSSSAPKTVHVKGYTRKDGTYVQGYDRKTPESQGSKTGEPGTKTGKSTVTSSYTGTSAKRDSHGR